LIANREAFQKAFDAVPYIWDDAMVSLLGQKVTVVSRVSPGIFGLTKSDARSNQPVWYYPFSVITCVEDKGTTGLQRSSITATTTTETTPPYIHLHHYRYYVEPPHVDPRPSYYYYGPYTTNGACQTLAWFEVPALVLMICLAITTAVSAYLLRAIEKEMPQIEPLPAGKMVVLACPDTDQVSPAPPTEAGVDQVSPAPTIQVVRATQVSPAPTTEVVRPTEVSPATTTEVVRPTEVSPAPTTQVVRADQVSSATTTQVVRADQVSPRYENPVTPNLKSSAQL